MLLRNYSDCATTEGGQSVDQLLALELIVGLLNPGRMLGSTSL